MNPRHHHDLCKLPRITHISDDFCLSARMCSRDDNKYEEELKFCREEAGKIDDYFEIYGVKQTDHHRKHCNPKERNDYNGIVISVLHGDPIIFVINNHMSCCEKICVDVTFPDGLSRDDFIGAVITNVKWGKEKRTDDYCFSEIIVETRSGNLTLTAVNEHNGYYSHSIIACFNEQIAHFNL